MLRFGNDNDLYIELAAGEKEHVTESDELGASSRYAPMRVAHERHGGVLSKYTGGFCKDIVTI